jgi:membrane-associated phospholipid phosphatase
VTEIVNNQETVANSWAFSAARYSLPVAFVLSATAIVVVFWGWLQLDIPVARFIRSLHIPWLEFAGDAMHRLGSGAALVALSGTLLALGWWKGRLAWRQAGLEGLLAHGLVASIVLVLKHAVGRPRPRLMHGNGSLLGPSWDEGLDSFPSGHTSASFAVATVLARHFPRGTWLFYSAATLVGLSRVLRGSHYPTDVLAGVALGVLAGAVIASPLRQWGRAFVRQLVWLSPFLVGAFGLLWTAVRLPPQDASHSAMILLGVLFIVGGIAVLLYRREVELRGTAGASRRRAFAYEPVLVGVGLGLTTASVLVTILALFVTVSWSLAKNDLEPSEDLPPPLRVPLGVQIVLAVALATAVLIIQSVKGILPLAQ